MYLFFMEIIQIKRIFRNVESDDITRTRINDRILEMCKPIHMGGESKRTASGKQKMSTLKEVFSK